MTVTEDGATASVEAAKTSSGMVDETFDPKQFLATIEAAWQARDGEAAAAGYAEDAVLIYGNGLTRRGEELRAWPGQWFDYAKDLQIHKTLRACTGNCVASEWESRYTHPESGEPICERGAEFFFVRPDGKVYRHHMYEHTWVDGKAEESTWPAASEL